MIPVEKEEVIAALRKRKVYFRVNTLKVSLTKFPSIFRFSYGDTEVPFMKTTHVKKLGSTLEFLSGIIHVHSYSSVFPVLALEPKEGEEIYDAAASPGTKTTLMAMLMKNRGVIVAVDRRSRLSALLSNIDRLGVINTAVHPWDVKKVYPHMFDKALLDAPCTALGSHAYAWERFSPTIAKALSRVQKRMLLSVFDSLKPGGIVVYSTCTLTTEENEEVISFLLKNRSAKLESVEIPVPHEHGLSDYGREFRRTVRIYPWHVWSDGFFIAKIRKLE